MTSTRTISISTRTALGLVAPSLAVFALATLLPFIVLAWMSVHEMDLSQAGTQANFVGLHHYVELIGDERFRAAIWTTSGFVATGLAIETIAGCALGFILHSFSGAIRKLVSTVVLIPMVIAPVLVGLTWLFLLQPNYGLMAHILAFCGIEGTILSDPGRALLVVRLVDVWEWTPFVGLVIAAALDAIPKTAREAAEVDGINFRDRIRFLYWPATRRLLFLVMILRTIDTLKVFDSVYLLTGGGPGTSTELISLFIHRVAIGQTRIGYGAAATVLLSYIVLGLTAIFYRQVKRV